MICLGGEIIIHAYDLSNDFYQLFWYQFNSNSKYMIWFMIGHTQKPYYFASFKSLNCSLETFTNVRLEPKRLWEKQVVEYVDGELPLNFEIWMKNDCRKEEYDLKSHPFVYAQNLLLS